MEDPGILVETLSFTLMSRIFTPLIRRLYTRGLSIQIGLFLGQNFELLDNTYRISKELR